MTVCHSKFLNPNPKCYSPKQLWDLGCKFQEEAHAVFVVSVITAPSKSPGSTMNNRGYLMLGSPLTQLPTNSATLRIIWRACENRSPVLPEVGPGSPSVHRVAQVIVMHTTLEKSDSKARFWKRKRSPRRMRSLPGLSLNTWSSKCLLSPSHLPSWDCSDTNQLGLYCLIHPHSSSH